MSDDRPTKIPRLDDKNNDDASSALPGAFMSGGSSSSSIHTSLPLPPPPSRDAHVKAQEFLEKSPPETMGGALRELLNQPAEVMAAILLRKTPLFGKDNEVVKDKIKQAASYVEAGLEERKRRDKERSKSGEQTMYFGPPDSKQLLPKEPFQNILSFLDKRDLIDTSLVSYEWAKQSLSPNIPRWQHIDYEGDVVYFYELFSDQGLNEGKLNFRDKLANTLQRPQFSLLKELTLHGFEFPNHDMGFSFDFEMDLLKRIATHCPNLEVLNRQVHSSVAPFLPSLFPNLSKVETIRQDDADGVAKFVKNMGKRLQHFPAIFSFGDTEAVTDERLAFIAENCPNLRSIYVGDCYRTIVSGSLTSQGVKTLVDACKKLEHMKVHGTSLRDGPHFEWRTVLQYIAQNASNFTRFRVTGGITINSERLFRECFGDRFGGTRDRFTVGICPIT